MRAFPVALVAPGACLVACALLVGAVQAFAGTYTVTVQPDSGDTYLKQDSPTTNFESSSELDVQTSSSNKAWNALLQAPLPNLAGMSVLRASLVLSLQKTNNPSSPMDLRVYPITQPWAATTASWNRRSTGNSWNTPGGAYSPQWSGRALVSASTPDNSDVSWPIGPMLEAWQTGDLANDGLLLSGLASSTTATATFRSTDYTAVAGRRPRLVITYTDEPPAIRNGAAEVQPRALKVGSTNVPLSLWLDVNATDATPSGTPTGFDVVILKHQGTLLVDAVDALVVGGIAVDASQVTWTDDGTTTTFHIPRVQLKGRVRLDLHVDVLSQSAPEGVDLALLVDDGTTPGAQAQELWPGDADGVAANGDDWLLVFTTGTPTSLSLLPATATIVKGACTPFELFGRDASGNVFPLVADAWSVVPANAGTVSFDGTFCANSQGSARLIARYGALADTSALDIVPANTPTIGNITLKAKAGNTTSALAPGDTMFAEVRLSDGDGFQDIRRIDWDLFDTGHDADAAAPAHHATFRWSREAVPHWSLVDPAGSTWQLLASQCVIDTTVHTGTTQTVRLAFVTSRIARASTSGAWSCRVSTLSDTPQDTSSATQAGWDATPTIAFAATAAHAEFGPASPGTAHVPMRLPASGGIGIEVSANAPYRVLGHLHDLVGATLATDTIFVHRGSQPFTWANNTGGSGVIDTTNAVLLDLPAPEADAPTTDLVSMWADYAPSLHSQTYDGSLHLAATLPTFGTSTTPDTVPTSALVQGTGLAAHSAVAEVRPHAAIAGAPTTFDAYLLPDIQGTDTGVNALYVTVPAGFGTPAVSGMWIGGVAVSYHDRSSSGQASAVTTTRAANGQLVRVRFTTTAPTTVDATGSDFAVSYEDTSTTVATQAAVEGDANGVDDGDTWLVTVGPAPLAAITIEPASFAGDVDTTVAFGASGLDAFGNAVAFTPTWSVTGGVGTIDADGTFRATHHGEGGVVATSDGVRDTAEVAVLAGPAASLVTAEVEPRLVSAGTAVTFDMYALARIGAKDTGIDWLRVRVPGEWGTPVVTAAWVGGVATTFSDLSQSGAAVIALGTRVRDGQLARVRFTATAPTAPDTGGADFFVSYDDTETSVPQQLATAGDADGIPDDEPWRVRVGPGPLDTLAIAPRAVTCNVDSLVAFTVSGLDAYGNAVGVTPAWSVTGGMGSIGVDGTFHATHAGTGRVIAASGAFADSAIVTVNERPSLALRAVHGATPLYPGESAGTFSVVLVNASAESVAVETASLSFRRVAAGDADADFAALALFTLPRTLAAGAADTLRWSVSALAGTTAGVVTVDASASGHGQLTGAVATASGADTTLALTVGTAGVELSFSQQAALVAVGDSAVLGWVRLVQHGSQSRHLRRLALADASLGPGTVPQLDAALGRVTLWRDDGDGMPWGAADTLLASATASADTVGFAGFDVTLPPESPVTLALSVRTGAAHRGDTLDVAIASASALTFAPAASPTASYPLEPWGGLLVQGVPAAGFASRALSSRTINPSATNRLALDVTVPANGYLADVLEQLSVVNLGTALAGSDLARLVAWADDGDGAFDALHDRKIATLAYTGGRWQASGIGEPVPLAGLRLYVTADVAPLAEEGRTLQLALPGGPQPGIGTRGGNAGPVDHDAACPTVLTVTNQDRVTLTPIPLVPGQVRPGDTGVPLLAFQALNTYASERVLTGLAVGNLGTGRGTPAQLDDEARAVELRADGDGDGVLDDADTDPVIATGSFRDGAASFGGLQWTIPAGATRTLFVTADVSPKVAADGDVLAAGVASADELVFRDATAVVGAWPLTSGVQWTVDGFGAAQVTNVGARAATLSPLDAPVVALDVTLPANGYASDVLRSVRVENLGTATVADVAGMWLWKDGGDGMFGGATSDDSLLTALTPVADGWQSPLLSLGVNPPGVHAFVSVAFQPTAAESSTVRLALPVNGVECASGNTGPNDVAVANPNDVVVSTSPLLATLELPPAGTIGAPATVRMIVRNVGAETLDGVAPTALVASGEAALQFAGACTPASLTLAPAQSDTFTWSATCVAAGEERLTGAATGVGATSALTRRAPSVTSGLLHVYQHADHVDLYEVETMPASVNRGQANVVPFALTFDNPGGTLASDVRLSHVRFRLEDEAGALVRPAKVLARAELNEGSVVFGSRTTFDTTATELDLPLVPPAVVAPSHPTTLNLRLDVLESTTVPGFRVVLLDSTMLTAVDATSGAPVIARVGGGGWPVRSNVARVVSDAAPVTVAAIAADTLRVARGATSVPLVRVRLTSPGVPGISSDVRLSAFAIDVRDSAGGPVADAATWLGALRARSGASLAGARAVFAGDGATLVLALSPPLNLPAGTPVDLVVEGDVAASAPVGRFGARFGDSALVVARDANTRARVATIYASDPVDGSRVRIEAAAETLRVAASATLPAAVLAGQTNVGAFGATLVHTGAPGTARIAFDRLTVTLRDEQRRALAPAAFAARLRVRLDGADVASTTALPDTPEPVTLTFAEHTLEPGDSARIELRLDASPAAPLGWFELVTSGSGLGARDANTGAALAVTDADGVAAVIASGLARVLLPGRQLTAGLESLMPASLAPDARPRAAARLVLRNADAGSSGAIAVDHLVVRGADRAHGSIALGAAASVVEAWVGGTMWASSAALSPDSATATLAGAAPLSLGAGDSVAVELRVRPRADGSAASVRVGLDASGIGVVQPASALLAIAVQPAPGASFPLWSEAATFTAADFARSVSNFPNPFAAGRASTTFAYWLRGAARITLRVLDARGDVVVTLADGAARPAGLAQQDHWDGRNGRGDVVVNGVYVAELTVRYDDGGGEHAWRKVMVVR